MTRAKKSGHWALGLWTLAYHFFPHVLNTAHAASTYITKDKIWNPNIVGDLGQIGQTNIKG